MVKSNLAKLMKEKKLTYRRLAELSGVAGETINRARGTLIYECKLSTLDALAKVLDVNIKDLFDENEVSDAVYRGCTYPVPMLFG